MEYIKWIFNNIDSIKVFFDIFIDCIQGVVIIIGINYLKTFKDKKNIATFTFWSQLSTRLMKIVSILENEKNIVNNLYKSNNEWDDCLTPENERITEFKELIIETSEFIDNTIDQIPAYRGWTDDYDVIKSFISDVKLYDICNSDKYFKYLDNVSQLERDKNTQQVINAINQMRKRIKLEQKKIEKKIC